jgi:acyl carrier protein
MNEFCKKISKILEVDEVKASDVLTDFFAWDSLAVLSVIAELDSLYGINVDASEISNLKTVGDLVDFVEVRTQLKP